MDPEVHIVAGEPVELVHDCNALCGDDVTRTITRRSIPLDGRWLVSGPKDAPTLDHSILCEACGLHGFWRNGKWSHA
jgi:hypothetical protein